MPCQVNTFISNVMNNEELKLGSITEIWKSGVEWTKYHQYLDTMEPEGLDSEGEPMKLSRYAHFLRLYVDLYHQEKVLMEKSDPKANEILKKSVLDIKSDPVLEQNDVSNVSTLASESKSWIM